MAAALNEDQWLRYNDLSRLLNHLRKIHKIGRTRAGRRKLRLFACACCRQLVWDRPVKEEFRRLVEVAESHADGRVAREELSGALRGLKREDYPNPSAQSAWFAAVAMASAALESSPEAARRSAMYARFASRTDPPGEANRLECRLLRDVFGNPFRPVTFPRSWLSWDNGTLPKMARTIYDERRFADLPILADALEEAGCADPDVLAHCRDGGVHVLGCWVVDRLLGKS